MTEWTSFDIHLGRFELGTLGARPERNILQEVTVPIEWRTSKKKTGFERAILCTSRSPSWTAKKRVKSMLRRSLLNSDLKWRHRGIWRACVGILIVWLPLGLSKNRITCKTFKNKYQAATQDSVGMPMRFHPFIPQYIRCFIRCI